MALPPSAFAVSNNNFRGLFPALSDLFDYIEREASKSQADAATAYGNAYTGNVDKHIIGAVTVITDFVNTLAPEQIDYMQGLGFTDSYDDKKKRQDVINSVLSKWDAGAAWYMKGKTRNGNVMRADLFDRLTEFDTVMLAHGSLNVQPD